MSRYPSDATKDVLPPEGKEYYNIFTCNMKNCSAIVVVLIHIEARKVEPKWKIKVVTAY